MVKIFYYNWIVLFLIYNEVDKIIFRLIFFTVNNLIIIGLISMWRVGSVRSFCSRTPNQILPLSHIWIESRKGIHLCVARLVQVDLPLTISFQVKLQSILSNLKGSPWTPTRNSWFHRATLRPGRWLPPSDDVSSSHGSHTFLGSLVYPNSARWRLTLQEHSCGPDGFYF